jgi:thioesterase domain-containing protein
VPNNLVLLRAGEAGLPPLFCVHAASGISTVYRDLALSLEGNFPVWGIQAHGFEIGESPLTSIKEMAVSYAKSINEVIGKGSCRLLGWSVGGLLAHAVAYELESFGAIVEDLILLDARTQLIEGLNLQGDESDEEVIFEHILSEALELEDKEVATFLAGADNKLAALQRLMIDQGVVSSDVPLEVINKISHQMILYPQRLLSYKMGVICAPITSIRAALEVVPENEDVFDWTSNTSGGVKEYLLRAKHNEMVEPKQSAQIAKLLKF